MSFFTKIRTKKRQRRSWNKVKSRRRRDSFDIRSRISLTFKMKGRRSLGLARGGICTFLCTRKHTHTHTHIHSFPTHSFLYLTHVHTHKNTRKRHPTPTPIPHRVRFAFGKLRRMSRNFSSLRCKQSTAKRGVICRSLTTLPTTSLVVKWRRNLRRESYRSAACRSPPCAPPSWPSGLSSRMRRRAPCSRRRRRTRSNLVWCDCYCAVSSQSENDPKIAAAEKICGTTKKTKKFLNFRNEYWNSVKL